MVPLLGDAGPLARFRGPLVARGAWPAAALVALLGALAVAPVGVLLLGVVIGGLNALFAAGLVLIHRANRIVNFAHAELGACAAVLGVQLMRSEDMPFAVAFAAAVGAGALAGALTEVLVVRRFANASRLVLTVATIGLAQVFAFGELLLAEVFDARGSATLVTPFTAFEFSVSDVRFTGDHLVALAAVPLLVGGLAWFLRATRYGRAVRAVSESSERAAQLGVPVRRVSLLVWVIAAVLAAVAGFLRGPIIGLTLGSLIGPGLLLRVLAAAVLARMERLWVAVGVAIGIGVFEQVVQFETGRAALVDAALFLVVLGGLIMQRNGLSRADDGGGTWRLADEPRPAPRELRRLPELRVGVAMTVTLVVVALATVVAGADDATANSLSLVPIYALVTLSLVVLTGWAGMLSLGQFALVGIGAAVGASLTADAGWDFLVALPAGGLAGSAAALVLGAATSRLRGPYLAVATLAFAVATSAYFLTEEFGSWLMPERTPLRPVLFGRHDLENERTYLVFCLVVLVGAILAVRALRRSRTGRILVAVRDNDRALQAYAVSAAHARLTACGLSGFLAGVAGVLYAHHQHAVSGPSFAPVDSLSVFSMAVIGGLGSVSGAVLGAVYVRGAQFLFPGSGQLLVSGMGMLVLLLFLPGGLAQLVDRGRMAVLRAVAERRGLRVPSLFRDDRDPTDDAGPDAPVPGASESDQVSVVGGAR